MRLRNRPDRWGTHPCRITEAAVPYSDPVHGLIFGRTLHHKRSVIQFYWLFIGWSQKRDGQQRQSAAGKYVQNTGKFVSLLYHKGDTLSAGAMVVARLLGGIQQALASAFKTCFREHQIIVLRIESNIR